MLRIERSEFSEELDHGGARYTLVAERIDFLLGRASRQGAIGASYLRPKAIAHHGQVVPIIDVVMIVKLVGLLAVAVAAFVTEVRR